MLLNFCLGCKKKKLTSSLSDDGLDSENICLPRTCKSLNKSINNKPIDQVDNCQVTSPSLISKFTSTYDSSPIHFVNTDGSIRIKTNAINRALPDIPTNDLINTSLNSNTSAILNRSIDRSLTPPFNVTNLPVNQLNDASSANKHSCILSTSIFNPSLHNSSSLQNSLIGITSNQVNSESMSNLDGLNELNEKKEDHSYAQIKNNVIVDSSTENDTDDYYDSTVLAKRGLDLQKVTINVPPAIQNVNESISSLCAVSNDLQNLNRPKNFELSYQIAKPSNNNNSTVITNHQNSNFLNSNHTNSNFSSNTQTINAYDLSADEEPAKEVSYNKISVREPLAKVLADRAALIEHHYTEVYDENNSFYEEIAGSTNSSVTYTKISDLISTTNHESNQLSTNSVPVSSQNNLSYNQLSTNQSATNSVSNPIQIPIETSLLTIKHSSRSTSPLQNLPILQTFQPNSNLTAKSFSSSSSFTHQQPFNFETLYTQVNKFAKTNKKSLPVPPNQKSNITPSNINDLYAKVQKNSKMQNDHNFDNIQRKSYSSTPDMNHVNPPPIPSLDKIPKNPKANLFTIKSNINLNNSNTSDNFASTSYNSYNLNVYPQHKRSFSSGSQYQDNDSDYYETFPKSIDNHSYETVKKNDKSSDVNDDDKEIIDAGYEIINYPIKKGDNSDEDSPCYETIASSKQNGDELDDCISEPDYEVIKTTNKFSNFKNNGLKLSRKESDASSMNDPGYERLMRPECSNSAKNKIDELKNENYEVLSNNPNHFIERL